MDMLLPAPGRFTIRRWMLLVFIAAVMLAAATHVLPANAAEQVSSLPFVNNFATARFKLLGTTQSGNTTIRTFGEGAVVLPDKTSAWIGVDGVQDLVYIVQIGNTVYQRVGAGKWQQVGSVGNLQTQPLSAQFNMLQQYANGIINFGDDRVGNTPVTHYQVWVSGENALAMAGQTNLASDVRDLISKSVYKYDFWIGKADSFLYQQNVEITIPATTLNGRDVPETRSATLMTFYNINDPTVSVNAPK